VKVAPPRAHRSKRAAKKRDPVFREKAREIKESRARGDSIEPPRALRRLTDEEIALWAEVARSVARRRGATLLTPSNSAHSPLPPAAAPVSAEPPQGRPAKPASPPPLAPIERRLKRELRRGRAEIDGALDLHGLTQAEAHRALRGFLRHSQARGARLVIVVTGKGGLLDERGPPRGERGVLRRLAPHWLRDGDLRSVVLGFEEAGRAHGGEGALYVRLRRLDRPSERS
jgi:DNA-nicking Smr family endonuclease